MAATATLGPPSYDGVSSYDAGYVAGGRWFRFVSATLTVAPTTVADPLHEVNGSAGIALAGVPAGVAQLSVAPGGGTGSIWWLASFHNQGPFRLAPRVGDRLALSIYYDQHGHDYFTATDTTQGTTQTIRVSVGDVIYSRASLTAGIDPAVTPPPATDTRLWQFTGTRLTTYRGDRGTLTGPWTTSALIDTSTGTSSGRVAASPSGLSNGGQDFGVWLRAVPVTYTQGFAGYEESGGPFRFIATTLTVPARQNPPAGSEYVQVILDNPAAATNIRAPEADLVVLAGGGPGTIRYGASNTFGGHFTISPGIGDRLTASIYYDQHGHYVFTATDLTQHTTQAVTTTAFYADQMPLNYAGVLGYLDTAFSPPADTRLFAFTGTRVTTYGGTHGSILGPWATGQTITTYDGTAAGAVVMSPSALSNGGQDFTIWRRHF